MREELITKESTYELIAQVLEIRREYVLMNDDKRLVTPKEVKSIINLALLNSGIHSGYTPPLMNILQKVIYAVFEVMDSDYEKRSESNRKGGLVMARQIAGHIAKVNFGISSTAISKELRKDTSTIIKAWKRVEELLETDREFRKMYYLCLDNVNEKIKK